jgi:hypothetical protein
MTALYPNAPKRRAAPCFDGGVPDVRSVRHGKSCESVGVLACQTEVLYFAKVVRTESCFTS